MSDNLPENRSIKELPEGYRLLQPIPIDVTKIGGEFSVSSRDITMMFEITGETEDEAIDNYTAYLLKRVDVLGEWDCVGYAAHVKTQLSKYIEKV